MPGIKASPAVVICHPVFTSCELPEVKYFENNEPIPFILDDILVNFDDARSRASLDVLGELSRKTQVLFFTHHARVAELAQEVVSPSALSVHNLNELGKQARMRTNE